jgi:hypothetical protein
MNDRKRELIERLTTKNTATAEEMSAHLQPFVQRFVRFALHGGKRHATMQHDGVSVSSKKSGETPDATEPLTAELVTRVVNILRTAALGDCRLETRRIPSTAWVRR